MLTNETVTKIENKLEKDNLKLGKLARMIHCSKTCLNEILYSQKKYPVMEKRLMLWLEDKLITDFNYEDFIADKNYLEKKLKERTK